MSIAKAKETMTSRERVTRTFAHQETDRVPIDYVGNLDINRRMFEHFNIKDNDYEKLIQELGVDFRSMEPPYKGPRLHPEVEGRFVDPLWGIHMRWIEHETGGYFDYCDFPLVDADEDEVAAWPMPNPDDFDYDAIAKIAEERQDMALYHGNPGLADIINSTGMLRTMEEVMVDLISEEPAGLLLIDRKINIQLEIARRTLEACKGKLTFLWMGEDLGTQKGPMISLDLYRKVLRPRHQQFIDLAKEYDLPVMIHSCGSSSWAYDDFIEMGIDSIDTLQPEAANMAPKYLKEKYGDKLSFHGMISTAGPLAYGTADDVERDVRERLELMMPGGGYHLAPTHAIQDNSPTENVIRMYEAAHKYGVY